MATATVYHFGIDSSNRILTLRHAGYDVHESDSLDRLRLDLEGDDIDAVIVSGTTQSRAEKAAVLVRKRSGAPLILFRPPNVALDESRFDRVYSARVPARNWLFDTAVLVMQSKELREASEHLRDETEPRSLRSRAKSKRGRRKLEGRHGGLSTPSAKHRRAL